MTRIFARMSAAAGIAAALLVAGCGAQSEPRSPGLQMILERSFILYDDGVRLPVEEGVILLPENRDDPDTRMVAVHFLRLLAKEGGKSPPWFFLPGGPGSTILLTGAGETDYADWGAVATAWGRSLVDLSRGQVDIVLLNQRGNRGLPLSPQLSMRVEQRHPRDPADVVNAVLDAQQFYAGNGVDLEGYDILDLVDDVEDVRKALGYGKIVLVGGSFGSQWSFAYLRRYEQNVERALLYGVEPLDFAYDSPHALDQAIRRVLTEADAAYAAQGRGIEGGLWKAMTETKAALDRTPAGVRTSAGKEIAVTGTDFANMVRSLQFSEDELYDAVAALPAFIRSVVDGDYSAFAAAHDTSPYVDTLIGLLIDNSLGISAQRDEVLLAEAKEAFVGEINGGYRSTRDHVATRVVDPAFREFVAIRPPVLMVQGDLDFSTPLENALAQLPWLENGAMLRVRRGTHNIFSELMNMNADGKRYMQSFLLAPPGSLGEVDGRVDGERIVDLELPAFEFAAPR